MLRLNIGSSSSSSNEGMGSLKIGVEKLASGTIMGATGPAAKVGVDKDIVGEGTSSGIVTAIGAVEGTSVGAGYRR